MLGFGQVKGRYSLPEGIKASRSNSFNWDNFLGSSCIFVLYYTLCCHVKLKSSRPHCVRASEKVGRKTQSCFQLWNSTRGGWMKSLINNQSGKGAKKREQKIKFAAREKLAQLTQIYTQQRSGPDNTSDGRSLRAQGAAFFEMWWIYFM